MNIDKFKHQHDDILQHIDQLRHYSRAGISQHAQQIAQTVVAMSATVKLHLSAEDRVLYPTLERSPDTQLAAMSRDYQHEMAGIAAEYETFSRRWNTAQRLIGHDDAFRHDANRVLRQVYERMQRENHAFYPLIEAM